MFIIHAFLRLTRISTHRVGGAARRSCCGGADDGEGEDRRRRVASSVVDEFTRLQSEQRSPSFGTDTPSLTSEYEGYQTSSSAIRLCLANAALFYGIAVLGLSFAVENFSVIDSLYLASVTITTIGYGDIGPTSLNAKLFVMGLASYGTYMFSRGPRIAKKIADLSFSYGIESNSFSLFSNVDFFTKRARYLGYLHRRYWRMACGVSQQTRESETTDGVAR